MDDIQIYEFISYDLRGATVIDGFPSVGLVSTISANYLINALNMVQIGILDSALFPTVSVVRESEPLSPVRVYATPPPSADAAPIDSESGETPPDKVVCFISEFQPAPNLIRPIADAILHWSRSKGAQLLISPEGLVLESADNSTVEKERKRNIKAYGIGSTTRAREMLGKHDVEIFPTGVITGVAGVLLNGGKRLDFDVIALLAEAHPDYPDAKAAAKVIETINRILQGTEIDSDPLYREAEGIEAHIKALQQQAKVNEDVQPTGTRHSPMYG